MSDKTPGEIISELQNTYNELAKRAADAQALLKQAEGAYHVSNEINRSISDGAKHVFLFLIDGSGSMSVNFGSGKSSLAISVSGMAVLQNAAPLIKNSSVHGGFWGNSAGIEWFGNADFNDPAVAKRVWAGLNCGTDFHPAVADVQQIATFLKNDKIRLHLAVVSDGDLFDPEKSKQPLQQLLTDNKNITLDVLIISPYKNTQMHTLAEDLQKSFPKRVSVKDAANENSFMEVVGDRLNPPKAKKAPAPKNG